ncbi:MAG: MFS transporter [Saprospiraceae bacterium]|nr:MFS transporter [Saprospiraceae bacterium]
MKAKVRFELSTMMFLEYYIWGTWFVAMGRYLSDTLQAESGEIGTIYALSWIGAMISPFFVGSIADRYFAAQKVNGVLHILGGGLLYILSITQDIGAFYWGMLFYSILFMPTIALTNSIAMNQSSDVAKDFPLLRVLGTAGWIVSNVVVGTLDIGNSNLIFIIPAVISVGFGIYSFFLPDTPPKPTKASVFKNFASAFVLFKDRSYTVFFIGSVLLCIPLSFYYSYANVFLANGAGMTNTETIMAVLGQGSEVFFMLALPFLLKRWGVRNILLIGMGAWVLRYLMFRYGLDGGVWLLYIGVLLHGICYDFFFATGQIYTDLKAPQGIKGAAQGLITFATYGVGLTIGSKFGGMVAEAYTTDGVIDWSGLWLVPAAIAGVLLVIFLLLFRDKTPEPVEATI